MISGLGSFHGLVAELARTKRFAWSRKGSLRRNGAAESSARPPQSIEKRPDK